MPPCKIDPITQAYHEVKGLIYQTTHKFYYRTHYRFDLDDLMGEANLMFVKAWRTYDSTKNTKFSTWVRTVVWTGLEHWSVRESKVQYRYHTMSNENMEYMLEPKHYDYDTFYVESLIKSLSQDSQDVIKFTLNLPQELQEDSRSMRGGWNGYSVKAVLRKYLKRSGWTYSRIRKVIAEIKTAVRDHNNT